MKNPFAFIFMLLALVFASSCHNNQPDASGTNSESNDNGTAAPGKALSLKEQQVFHATAQRSLNVLQKEIDSVDKAVKKAGGVKYQNWPASRDSVRKIVDKANFTLNSQGYKSDMEWETTKRQVDSEISVARDAMNNIKNTTEKNLH